MLGGKELALTLNLSPETIRHYADEGLIPCQRTPGGHRRYDLDEVRRALRLVTPRTFARIDEVDTIMLDPNPEATVPLRRARTSRSGVTSAAIAEALGIGDERPVPFIGVPGTSRFIIGQGARA